MTSLDVFLEGRNLPRYLLGQRVYFADGRNGIVLDSAFNPNAAQWQYAVEGIGAWFLEGDLLASAPVPVEPEAQPIEDEPLRGDAITRAEVVRLLGDAISTLSGAGISEARLQEVIRGAIFTANLAAQANNIELRGEIDAEVQSLARQFESLESTVTTTLSEFDNRLGALDAAADEDPSDSSGGGILGFVSGVSGFLRNPFDWLLDRVGERIIDEVRNGSNRRSS